MLISVGFQFFLCFLTKNSCLWWSERLSGLRAGDYLENCAKIHFNRRCLFSTIEFTEVRNHKQRLLNVLSRIHNHVSLSTITKDWQFNFLQKTSHKESFGVVPQEFWMENEIKRREISIHLSTILFFRINYSFKKKINTKKITQSRVMYNIMI